MHAVPRWGFGALVYILCGELRLFLLALLPHRGTGCFLVLRGTMQPFALCSAQVMLGPRGSNSPLRFLLLPKLPTYTVKSRCHQAFMKASDKTTHFCILWWLVVWLALVKG